MTNPQEVPVIPNLVELIEALRSAIGRVDLSWVEAFVLAAHRWVRENEPVLRGFAEADRFLAEQQVVWMHVPHREPAEPSPIPHGRRIGFDTGKK